MRLDQFLKVSRLIIRRPVATEVCRAGVVEVNDIVAKPGRELKPSDTITLRRNGQKLRVRVVTVPTGNVPKSQAASLYEILSSEPYNEVADIFTSPSGSSLESDDQDFDDQDSND